MSKKSERIATVPSWYPSTDDVRQTQRAQMEASKRDALAFASQTFHRGSSSWWRRLLGLR